MNFDKILISMVLLVILCVGFIQSAVFYRNSPKQIARELKERKELARSLDPDYDYDYDDDDDYYY